MMMMMIMMGCLYVFQLVQPCFRVKNFSFWLTRTPSNRSSPLNTTRCCGLLMGLASPKLGNFWWMENGLDNKSSRPHCSLGRPHFPHPQNCTSHTLEWSQPRHFHISEDCIIIQRGFKVWSFFFFLIVCCSESGENICALTFSRLTSEGSKERDDYFGLPWWLRAAL
jgi:hypothetical protein